MPLPSSGRTLPRVSTKSSAATRTPSLTERRKAATQFDIARAAAELFTERGPDGTTAEEIAVRAGVALRTFYRYFRNKQDAVGPSSRSAATTGGSAWRRQSRVPRSPGRWNRPSSRR